MKADHEHDDSISQPEMVNGDNEDDDGMDASLFEIIQSRAGQAQPPTNEKMPDKSTNTAAIGSGTTPITHHARTITAEVDVDVDVDDDTVLDTLLEKGRVVQCTSGTISNTRTAANANANATRVDTGTPKVEEQALETPTRANADVDTSTRTHMPTLERQRRPPPESQPGAFALGGRGESEEHQVEEPVEVYSPTSTNESQSTNRSLNDGLVEAREVEDEENPAQTLPHAQEYRYKAAENGFQQYRPFFCGVLVIVMLAVLLGLYFGVQNGENKESSKQEEQSLPPTVILTNTPTATPSAAPSAIMADLFEILPDYTLESLRNFSSPQSEALRWLENYPNISQMETWRKEQLLAMTTFYHAMNGSHWAPQAASTWIDYETSECQWFSTVEGYVNEDGTWTIPEFIISFAHNQLSEELGYQPTQCDGDGRINAIALLGAIQPATGVRVPPEIELLSSLQYFDLSFNQLHTNLEDVMPPQLFQLKDLVVLGQNFNFLTGTLPTSIGLLTKLENFEMMTNMLKGTLPTQVAMLTDLQFLAVLGTQLTGNLPSELGLLTSLTSLGAEQNMFTGTIPTEWRNMKKLKQIYLSRNPGLTSSIPPELGELSSLNTLNLDGCSFTGTLPSELFLLTSLGALYLQANLLTGVLPTDLGLLSSLKYLHLGGNELSGPIPHELALLTSLKALALGGAFHTGTIPRGVGLLQNLTRLMLTDSLLTGMIPSEIGLLSYLQVLDLSNNPDLSGPIPSEIGLLRDLFELFLSNNTHMSGSLPLELEELVSAYNLSEVYLQGSVSLTGEIPAGVCFLQIPNCSYPYGWYHAPCVLEFECTGYLCGCGCNCTDTSF
ncbi:LRR receptor-like serine threonine-protein kinase [Seminavis robusta]|uniref:LRR receptor-like serine threonine-protein kinase n=1 Tax=Seminavis robusta TaxID=568900 RepID=A0A9N8H3P7_9STRA|nr:LRR receptor-like serine threonine-protein kinase [Seminavis robusta]|eukprot:Sro43_g026290.1 LRR receptor-like serine threonine-protein kinase (839) ;mRNA; r:107385-109901